MPDDLSNIRYLPAVTRDVVEAEIVTPAMERQRREKARRDVVRRDIETVGRVTRTVVTHPATVTVGRHTVYVGSGLLVVITRAWESWSSATINEEIRAARTRGESEAVIQLLGMRESARQGRSKRAMAWIRLPFELARVTMGIVVAWFASLLFIGLLWSAGTKDWSHLIEPVSGFVTLVTWICWFVAAAWVPLLAALPWVVVYALWRVGRSAGSVPTFLAAGRDEPVSRELIPDEGAILAALRELNHPKLNQKFKAGWQPRWVMPTTRDGNGYRTQLEMPQGVPVRDICTRRGLLAHNLVRLPVETWPTEPQQLPGVLDLWVADQGLLTGAAPPYPLLDSGKCDFFKGVPVGFDQRGDLVMARLMASNYLIGGMMGSGKSSLVINLMAGAALDPLVDIYVYVMAYNVDYDPFRPRLAELVKGDEDEHITAAMDGLSDLREEVTKRGRLLAEMGGEETKLTRAIAEKDARMRPRLVVFDEVQEMYRHQKYGPMAKELAIKVITKARKTGICIVKVTPEASADSLPRELARVMSHRACFPINDWTGNDAILGTGCYQRGISAVDLNCQDNVGTAMASGFRSQPGILRSCYIRKDRTVDQLTPIVQRSMKDYRPVVAEQSEEPRDLLQDVHEALRDDDKLRASQVARRLRDMHPSYVKLDGVQLATMLGKLGVEVRELDGVQTIRAVLVLRAIDAREGIEWE